jgi:hypothetical protein
MGGKKYDGKVMNPIVNSQFGMLSISFFFRRVRLFVHVTDNSRVRSIDP